MSFDAQREQAAQWMLPVHGSSELAQAPKGGSPGIQMRLCSCQHHKCRSISDRLRASSKLLSLRLGCSQHRLPRESKGREL